jgi:hypothetical protein
MPTVRQVSMAPVAAQKPKKQLEVGVLLTDAGEIGGWNSNGAFVINYEVETPGDDVAALRPDTFVAYMAPDGTSSTVTDVELEAMDRLTCPKFVHQTKGRSGVHTLKCTGLDQNKPLVVCAFATFP